MINYTFKANRIKGWKLFHKEFKKVMCFPEYYGENIDAWIDCMEELSDEGESINIVIYNTKVLKEEAPDILEAILECSSFVNFRRLEKGNEPNILVTAHC